MAFVDVGLAVVESDQLDAAARRRLRALWDRAFGDRFTDHAADQAYGGVHVLARAGDRFVGHASAIPRPIRFGGQPWRTIGYVEAVSVDPDRQGEGIGRRVMERLHVEIAARWPVALLSTRTATPFYESLGWEQWQGPRYTRTATGVVADGDRGGLMIRRPDPPLVPDLSVEVTCLERPGRAW